MIYDLLANHYNSINRQINQGSWVDFYESVFKKYATKKPELILDLGCGTGKITLELARRGYDMTGVDISPQMLDIARGEAEKAGLEKKNLWLAQDICDFELYGTVEVCISSLDTINHLLSDEEVLSCFSLVHNYLDPDGLFIFDINGRYKFESIYADNTYAYEEKNSVLIWQNRYNKRKKICDFYITLFEKQKDGRYVRCDDIQLERMYKISEMKNFLSECGFEFIGAYSDFDFSPATDNSERIFIVARCKKS